MDSKMETVISLVRGIYDKVGEGGSTTYLPFPSTWTTTGTLLLVVTSILSDSTYAKLGMAYLGEIYEACTPWGSGNVECKVEFLQDNLAVLTTNSSNISPYAWHYNTASLDYTWKSYGGGESNLLIGTEAERLALTPTNGLLFNQINLDNSVTHYSYEDNLWKIILDNYENITISFTLSGGSGTLENRVVSVTEVGGSTTTYTITNNSCSFRVLIGTSYTISYPSVLYYSSLSEQTFIARNGQRTLSKIYTYLGDQIRAVVLERSNPDNWETSGSVDIVDSILNQYGTYVIDEPHKKYAQLSVSNHSVFTDGTSYTGTYGNVFRRLPRVYYKMTTNTDNEPVLNVSTTDVWNENRYWEEDWIGTYKGSVQNNVLVSRPNLTTTQSKTMSLFWDCAILNGTDYGLVNYFDLCKLQALHLAKFGKSNSESTAGPGLQNGGSSYFSHTTGTTAGIGDTTGLAQYLLTALYMNKLFGIEDISGSTWEFRPNIRFENSGATAIVYEGNIVSNTATGRSFNKLNSASGAYITKMVLGEYCDFIPSAVGGTNATYYCDGTWASSSGLLLLVGGGSGSGPLGGLFCCDSYDAFSYSGDPYGARLAFKGNIDEYQLVSGTELAQLNS